VTTVGSCWAAPLGGCKGAITGEHLFTKSIFTGKKVEVTGVPWFKGVSREISFEVAVGNILCEYNNTPLGASPDPAAK